MSKVRVAITANMMAVFSPSTTAMPSASSRQQEGQYQFAAAGRTEMTYREHLVTQRPCDKKLLIFYTGTKRSNNPTHTGTSLLWKVMLEYGSCGPRSGTFLMGCQEGQRPRLQKSFATLHAAPKRNQQQASKLQIRLTRCGKNMQLFGLSNNSV